MTTDSHNTASTAPPAPARPALAKFGAAQFGPTGSADLVSSQGTTLIADAVVAKIAGIATREISGVFDVGGGTARAVGALRDRIPGARVNHGQGVAVEVGATQAAIDIGIVAEYGVALHELAAGIRRNVIAAVERMTGLEVTEVNITVYDVVLFDEESSAPESESRPRVQ